MCSTMKDELAKQVAILLDALREADAAMSYAQWGTSHPARLKIAAALKAVTGAST